GAEPGAQFRPGRGREVAHGVGRRVEDVRVDPYVADEEPGIERQSTKADARVAFPFFAEERSVLRQRTGRTDHDEENRGQGADEPASHYGRFMFARAGGRSAGGTSRWSTVAGGRRRPPFGSAECRGTRVFSCCR